MPRQGVPYPSREICSLKCQIDALQRQINELMKSINGVQGDGQGDLTLVSGDPAIVINNDQAQHEIEIALDQSALPSALVSSVNGQTGVVDLDGADIPLNPGQSTPTVQNAVAANAGNISQLRADLNQEILDRGNADSALSTAINAALATIPGEVSSQIANDATINQLVTADAQNVKLTGAQAISGVKTVPTEATGSATQQIANGAKVKNELDAYAPMVRTTGNQTIAGIKIFTDQPAGHRVNTRLSTSGNYYNFMNLKLRTDGDNKQLIAIIYRNMTGFIEITEPSAASITITDLVGSVSSLLYFALYRDGTDYHIAVKQRNAESRGLSILLLCATKGNYSLNSGDISLEYAPAQVPAGWTQISNTE